MTELNEKNLNADDGATVTVRTAKKKLGFLGSKEGASGAMDALEDRTGEKRGVRPLKDPGFTWVEALWNKSLLEDGKQSTFSVREMMKRGIAWGKFKGQRASYALDRLDRKEEPEFVYDIGRRERMIAAGQHVGADQSGSDGSNFKEGLRSAGTSVGPSRHGFRVRFGMPPFENVVEMDKFRALEKTDPSTSAVRGPRLLTDRVKNTLMDPPVDAQSAPSAPRKAARIGVDRPAGLLPAPRPVAQRDPATRSAEVRKAQVHIAVGKSAARRAAMAKAKEQSMKLKKSVKSTGER